ncbi:acylphosphatase [Leptospira sp. GIMC2001]|uniref:acylphosphatase n=1 Tax=Leptospira sp. GIMC2001 TaxID=1513297 RepID=UPI002349E1FC|nr:acylphosphatase [Leptospira sp. GIMC2001]WCL49774.1 acylphosphatase [Leptospira sp. GIMC2001]
MGKEKDVRAKFIIRGAVQGVGFRYFVLQKAQEMRLKGYTQNLPNGEVEIVVEGEKIFLEDMERALQKGPTKAKVKEVVAVWQEAQGRFRTFEIKR